MATGDTKTESYLRIAAEGERDDLPTDTCCNTKTQNLILGVANRIMNVEDEVEELKNNPDVVDVVGTYQDLEAYDTSTLTDKDIIRVLEDSTHDDKSTFYRWNASTSQFDYVGEAGGGAPNVVQVIGSSTTDVMSQDATSKLVFNGGSYPIAIRIGNENNTNDMSTISIGAFNKVGGSGGVSIGANAEAISNNSPIAIGNAAKASDDNAIALGRSASAGGYEGISIGRSANASSFQSISIGSYAKTTASYGVTIGSRSVKANGGIAIGGANNSDYGVASTAIGSVAIGFNSHATRAGEVNIGDYVGAYGFNNSTYRVIGGVYDGQELHDAATVAQGNTLATSAPTTSTVGVLGQLYTDTTGMHTYQCTAISGSTYTWTQRW